MDLAFGYLFIYSLKQKKAVHRSIQKNDFPLFGGN